jgi:predicted DNA-binding transcriptional regulator YafY
MPVSRLFETVIYLLDKKTATASELARHFGVSIRTVYRDVEALSQAGIPIYASQGKNGGIGLMENFVLQKSLLNREEQAEILSALQGLQAVSGLQAKSALAKWRAVFGAAGGDWVAVDFSDWSLTRQNELALIKEGILHKKTLRFTYYGSNGERTVREAEPLKLWFKSRAWYLRAYCRLRQQERLFKLSRMKEVHLLEEHFSPRPAQDPEPAYVNNPARPGVALTIWLDSSQAFRAYDEFEEVQVERQPDGSFLIHTAYPEDEWVYGFLLSFGPHMRVLSPVHVREELQERLKKMTALYEEHDS